MDQEAGNITQKVGNITQRGPRPIKSKIEDIDLSDQEVEHTTKDSKNQRKEKLKTHIQRKEENQSQPSGIGGPMPGPQAMDTRNLPEQIPQPWRLGPPLEPRVIVREVEQSPKPGNLQALKEIPKREADQPAIEGQYRGDQREMSQAQQDITEAV